MKPVFTLTILFIQIAVASNSSAATTALATCEYFETTYTYPSHDKYVTTELKTESETCSDAKNRLTDQCTDICVKNSDTHYCSLKTNTFSCEELSE